MGKAGKLRKKRKLEAVLMNEDSNSNKCMENEDDAEQISEEDIVTTARVLAKLSDSNIFHSKEIKPIRLALHQIIQSGVLSQQQQTDKYHIPTVYERVVNALKTGDYDIATDELKVLRASGARPKIGTLQRWVREADGVFSSNILTNESAYFCLDAILRTADPESVGSVKGIPIFENSVIREHAPWTAFGRETVPLDPLPDSSSVSLQSVAHIKAVDRLPKNRYDLTIHSGELPLSSIHCKEEVIKYECPFLRKSFFLQNVMLPEECRLLVSTGERYGYEKDEPVNVSQLSVLAHAFVFLVGEKFERQLWNRVKDFFPKDALGLNRRFRCYKYHPGAVYRPHIDGAWPPSGLDENNTYVYDISNGKVLSKYTFLLYLNEDFEGGGTTYYTPSTIEGKMDRKCVTPKMGCAMVFPHGEVGDAPLHEGSEVKKGIKYVVRTEVLFPI